MLNVFNGFMAMMPPDGGQQGGGSPWSMLIMFGAIILVMYFLMIRPQQKRQKEHQNMVGSLKQGDKVITSSGIHGTITSTTEKTIILQIADNTKVTVEKTAVAQKV